jgi:hypothetical protein
MSSATRSTAAVISTLLAVVSLACSVSVASAFSLRAPQIAFASGPLQTYLNGVDGGIAVLTDQIDAPIFATGIAGNTDFTLTLKTATNASIGVYNGPTGSPLFQLFPASAIDGYRVLCHFDGTGGLIVNLRDDLNNDLGNTTYSGVDRAHFGFYIQSPAGTFYTQDGRNAGQPQVLTYGGTGINFGDWFICFEEAAYNSGTSTFDGAVMVLQAVSPTPTRSTTWGALKSTYR